MRSQHARRPRSACVSCGVALVALAGLDVARAFVGGARLANAMSHLSSSRRILAAGNSWRRSGQRCMMTSTANFASSAPPRPYDHKAIEQKWQRYWEENKTFRTPARDPAREKRYVLDMFPYPSGSGLHVGHPEGYTASDVMARYWRMKGFDVLHPMGWDSFGLPAEQHAIQTGTHPKVTTYKNIDTFRRQLKSLGFSYDWERELATTDDAYVRWTQWIFLQLFRAGLAQQSEARVNWCPALGTVLANEEVINGLSERGNHPVVRTPLRQWVLKITEYAEQLEAGLAGLEWPEGTLTAQRQWIGRSEGAKIEFKLDESAKKAAEAAANLDADTSSITVFTTRPDTLMGVTYLVLAPEHPLATALATPEQIEAVRGYAAAAAGKSDMDRAAAGASKAKTGVPTGAFATHPLSGEKVPIWVADYVLYGYGTGAVMAVPAHDERDAAFASTFDLPVRVVVKPPQPPPSSNSKSKTAAAASGAETDGPTAAAETAAAAYTGEGVAINSGEFDGLSTAECKAAVVARLQQVGAGGATVNYKLRDWIFSRQRYWGEPIPIYFPVDILDDEGDDNAAANAAAASAESEGALGDLRKGTEGEGDAASAAALASSKSGKGLGDPRKGAKHVIRYDLPQAVADEDLPLKLPGMDSFEPGDDPQGCLARAVDWRYFQRDGKWFARETNTMPQWAGSCWYYLRFADPKNSLQGWSKEADRDWLPVDLYVGGQEHAVLHLLYARFWHRVLHDLGHVKDPEPFQRLVHQGMILGADGEKMSKSRGNVVNPDDIVKEFGADALRMYEMFMGPLEAVKPWQTAQVAGVVRFRDRVHQLAKRADKSAKPQPETLALLHKTMKKVTKDTEALSFNTAIAALMVLTNHLSALDRVPLQAVTSLTLMVAPFAPHLGEECWQILGNDKTLAYAPWVQWDEALCQESTVTLGVQVNGKVRGQLEVEKDAPEDAARAAAEAVPAVAKWLEGKEVKKFIYVPGRIVSFVVGK